MSSKLGSQGRLGLMEALRARRKGFKKLTLPLKGPWEGVRGELDSSSRPCTGYFNLASETRFFEAAGKKPPVQNLKSPQPLYAT